MVRESWEYSTYGWRSAEATSAHAYILPAIKRLLPEGAISVLDVGCGNGYVAGQLSAMGYVVVGIDVSEGGIAIARRAYPKVRFNVYSGYDDLRAMIEPVDVVISSEVVEHLFRPKSFLDNVFRVLRPEGSLILTTPYHGYLKNLALSLTNRWDKHLQAHQEGGHIKFFSARTLSQMLYDCGFEDVTFRNAGRVPWLWKSMVCRAEKPNA